MVGMLVTLVLLALLARALGWRRGGDGGELGALLASAEAAGIITAEQRERLREHAARRAERASFGGAVWLALFAGLFVLAGVALVVAHNWVSIGPAVRVAAFVVVLGLAGEAAVRAGRRGPALAVALEVVWFLLPLVGIGLYGQTFQLSGDPIRPYLLWLVLTVPLAWLSAHPFVASLHTLALAGVLFTGNFGVGGMLALAHAGDVRPPVDALAWGLSLLVLGLIAAQSLRLLPAGNRHHFVGAIAVWLFALLVAPTALQLEHEGWLAVAAVALATVWLVALLAIGTGAIERMGAAMAWLGTLYALTFAWHTSEAFEGPTAAPGLAVAGLAIAAALGGIALLPRARLGAAGATAAIGKALLALPLVASLPLLTGADAVVRPVALVLNVLLVAIAVALMWHGSLARRIAEINLGILVLLVVLITRFLDVFGSFLEGGVGFIVAGLLLAVLAYALQRTRRRLIAAPQGAAR